MTGGAFEVTLHANVRSRTPETPSDLQPLTLVCRLNSRPHMQCRSVRELVGSTGDAWLATPGCVIWRIGGIEGVTLWGRVTPAQIDHVFGVARAQADRPGGALDLVTDLTAVTSFDDAIYLRMAAHLVELAPLVEHRVRHHTVIVPDGLLRGAVAGFLHLHAQHAWRLDDALPAAIAAEVAAIVEAARHDDLVGALRGRRVSDTLVGAAKALGVAPRTLQRALHGAGTSFRAIVEEGRISEARRLLDQTDLKVEAIAHEVGYGSLSGFVRSFRRVHGCSPHECRTMRRGHHPA